MPKSVDKLICQLEEVNKKLEYVFGEYMEQGDDVLMPLGEAIDALVSINEDLDSDSDEQQ